MSWSKSYQEDKGRVAAEDTLSLCPFIYIYRDDVDSRVKISKEKEKNGGGRNLCSITAGTVCSCSAVDFHHIQVHIKGTGQDLTHVFQIRNKGRKQRTRNENDLVTHSSTPQAHQAVQTHATRLSFITSHRTSFQTRVEVRNL